MSVYPRYQQHSKSWGMNAMGSVIVEVEAEDGTTGVGKWSSSYFFGHLYTQIRKQSLVQIAIVAMLHANFLISTCMEKAKLLLL